jgi:hypothetical protein
MVHKPEEIMDKTKFEIVHTLVVFEVNTGARELDAEAVKVYGDWSIAKVVGGLNVIVWLNFNIFTTLCIDFAGRYSELPACVAIILQGPELTPTTVFSAPMLQISGEADEKETANVLVELACRL